MSLDGVFFDRDGEPITMLEYAALNADLAYRHVGMTAIGDDVTVSTVWLGIDHNFLHDGPPVIFETLVVGGPFDQHMERYTNIDAARAGHDQMVAAIRDALTTQNDNTEDQ